MLYVIKEDRVYMVVKGDYKKSDYQEYQTFEDPRSNLVYNALGKFLEVRPTPEKIDVLPFELKSTNLVDTIRNTSLWDRLLDDGEKSLKLNIAVTLLISAVTTTKNNDAFIQGVIKYFSGLKDSTKTKEFSSQEIELLQTLIDDSEFNLDLSTLQY